MKIIVMSAILLEKGMAKGNKNGMTFFKLIKKFIG